MLIRVWIAGSRICIGICQVWMRQRISSILKKIKARAIVINPKAITPLAPEPEVEVWTGDDEAWKKGVLGESWRIVLMRIIIKRRQNEYETAYDLSHSRLEFRALLVRCRNKACFFASRFHEFRGFGYTKPWKWHYAMRSGISTGID